MDNKMERVRRCLREGPSTSSEVAATTGLTIKHACARLRSLEASGEVRRVGKVGRAVLFQGVAMGVR